MKTLFMLGHAGGNAVQYASLFAGMGKTMKLVPLELPGHGRRLGEPLLDNIADMVRDLRRQALDALAESTDYALFGHSMGGILAHALAVDLEGRAPTPAHVVISSTCTPGRHHIPSGFPELSDQDLWRESAAYFGGMPDQIATSAELMALFAPILRADLKAVLDWDCPRLPAVDAPITALCGDADIVDMEDAEIWRRYTTRDFAAHVLPGGHFHVLERPENLEDLLVMILNGLRILNFSTVR